MRLINHISTAIISFLLLIHGIFLSFANMPTNPILNTFFDKIKNPYVNGVFKQNWAFFTPIPKISREIQVQCSNDKINWGQPKGLLESYLVPAHSNPFSSNERISLMIKDLIDEVAQNLKAKSKPSNPSLAQIATLSGGICKKHTFVKLTLESKNVVQFSKRNTVLRNQTKETPIKLQSLGQWQVFTKGPIL